MRLSMNHLAIAIVALLAAWSLDPSAAAAQMTLTYESPDPNRLPSVGYVAPPLGPAECALTDPVAFRLDGLDNTGTFIDIWSGPGGTDCSTVEARNPLDGTCTSVTVTADTMLSGNPAQVDLNIPMSELIDCGGSSGGSTIWFLLANTLESTEVVTLSASLAVTYDQTPPGPPTGISDTSGDSMATITWTQAADTDIQRYDVWGDRGSLGASCEASKATTSLVEGADFVDAGYVYLGQSTGSSAVVNPGELGLADDQYATFVVISVDQALNASVVSEVSCISRVPTSGFCDASPDCENCSAAGRVGLRASGPWSISALSLLFALGLGLARRRRT